MAALEWDADPYLPLVAHQAQAGPRLVQNSSTRRRLKWPNGFRIVTGSSVDVAARHHSVVVPGDASCYRWNRVNETCHRRSRNNTRKREESKIEKFPVNPISISHVSEEDNFEDSTDCPSSGGEGSWSVMRGRWRIIGMATRLSPRNSEVNALEQRGYLIGKKIGQVVYYSLLSFVRF